MRCETVKVKPWSKDQGEYVEIDKESFDEKTHSLYVEGEQEEVKPKKSRQAE